MRKSLSVVALAAATALVMAGCSSAEPGSDGSQDPGAAEQTAPAGDPAAEAPEGQLTTVKVGANPVPHGEILKFIKDNLAADAGLDLQIEEFADYVLPNSALAAGDLDANYFQHQPYLDSQVAEFGYEFTPFAGVHIEPLGVYSSKWESVDQIPDGAVIGVSNDPANQARGLRLLETGGVLALKDTGDADPTVFDIESSAKNVQVKDIDPALLGPGLQDYDLAVINGNYAIEAGLKPSADALILESGADNPYANFLTARTADASRPELVKLDELLHSPEVKQFIADTWTDGSVIAAF
ncbi:MAG: MetQ/NlpA family ABC transporter substrate-binding protein [Bifidobacteriaceae bacterium]|nr:MetQ/NlpA family ABC transporter substrate-binding protein [Bifidobacteriaceae bacterium]